MDRHENYYIEKIAEILRNKFPEEFFITEVYTPYGTLDLKDKSGRPDILRINKKGEITIIEVKKASHSSLSKWQIVGELLFYKFLTNTQLSQDNDEYKWLEKLIDKGVVDQATIDSIEEKHKNGVNLVTSCALVICEGFFDDLRKNETLWHMYQYVREFDVLKLDILYLEEFEPDHFSLKLMNNWFLE